MESISRYLVENRSIQNELIMGDSKYSYEELRRLMELGRNKIKASALLLRQGRVRCITYVDRLGFDYRGRRIKGVLGNGIQVVLEGVDYSNIDDVLMFPVEVIITYRSNDLVAYITRIFGRHGDVKDLIESYDDVLADLIILGLGYDTTSDVRYFLLPRIVSLFRVDGKPLYVVQITPANTGKTYFGIATRVLNWIYTAEAPTFAYLVYDGRNKTLGHVWTREGIVFDGMDKWSAKVFNISADYEVLLTGMEQGIWSRGVSGAPTTTAPKYVNMLFFGNTVGGGHDMDVDNVKKISIWSNIDPFLDRIALVHYSKDYIPITKYVMDKRLPITMWGALIRMIQRMIDESDYQGKSDLDGRHKWHSLALQKVFKVLELDVSYDIVDDMVQYGWDYTLKNIMNSDVRG